jgi:hypothetical protein
MVDGFGHLKCGCILNRKNPATEKHILWYEPPWGRLKNGIPQETRLFYMKGFFLTWQLLIHGCEASIFSDEL